MALQDILDKIQQEGADKIAKLKKEFEDAVAKLREEYKEKEANEKENIIQSGKERTQKIKEKAEILAKMETKNTILKAKRAAMKNAEEELLKALSTSSKYEAYITKLLKKLSKEYEEGFVVPAKDKTAETTTAIKETGSKFAIIKEEGKFKGGFILKSKNIEIDCTFESLLQKQLQDQLEETFSKTLF
ncbi:V-type ATP synthase subunit E [Patescibacteria group bacterium]|nr:V-type ATP synthase subunit E [Patescibacteria group bacterium]